VSGTGFRLAGLSIYYAAETKKEVMGDTYHFNSGLLIGYPGKIVFTLPWVMDREGKVPQVEFYCQIF